MEIGQQPMMQLRESKKLKQSSVLTILVSLKEISFYFNNSHNKSVIDSKLVSIEENNDISSLLDLLKKTLSEFDLSNVLKVKLILNNKLSTLVPNELYDEKLNKDYLKYNCDLIDNDTTAVDEIIELDIKNIYVPYENINNFLIETFGSFDFFHFSSILIKKIYNKISCESCINFYVIPKNGLLNIILFEGKRLIFSNIFDYSCKEDVLYYILFVVDNVKNVNEGSEICIISKKEDMDDEINYLSKFIKNLKIIDENILE